MNQAKPRLIQRLLSYLAERHLVGDGRLLEWYPPFLAMRIKVLEIGDGWRTVRIRLPLNAISRNPGGVMFGGFQAALADPVAALACARVFPGHSVWTRAMEIQFEHGGSTDLELRFDFPSALEAEIATTLAAEGRATPTFEYGFYLANGLRCTTVRNTVAIRPRGFARATTPPAPDTGVE